MISVITPTCNRPAGLRLLRKYIARQTVMPDEWLICNGGELLDDLPDDVWQLHDPRPPDAANLAHNMLNGLREAEGDIVIIMEDDDWYAPNHIERCVAGLQNADAYGCPTLRYYHVGARKWREMPNRGSALCQTAITRALVPELQQAAQWALDHDSYGIDGRFWGGRQSLAIGPQTVIGIKGLPGTPGLGIGHRLTDAWRGDPAMAVLHAWIGEDAARYEGFAC